MQVIEMSPEDIPKDKDFNVLTSSFFQNHKELPTPNEVRARARSQYAAGTHWGWKKRSVNPDGCYNGRPVPAVFDEMGLFVKWGSLVKLTEGQTLYMIRKYCGESVPVPELYGWRTDGSEMFLYMEAVYGRTMEDAWPDLVEEDWLHICRELRTILHNLRQIRLPPTEAFVGSVTRGNYYERALFDESQSESGPFTSVKEFHDWFILQYKRMVPDPETIPEPYRAILPDDSEIVLTHGDLHRSNIILTLSCPLQVAALIDWEQSAWLPAYWEDCKAYWTTSYSDEWATKYLPQIVDHNEAIVEAWDYYTNPLGA